jgi:hypothetical protein
VKMSGYVSSANITNVGVGAFRELAGRECCHRKRRAIERGNPVVPTPARVAFPKPVVLRYAKAKSWKQFEQTTDNWHLSKHDDGWIFGPWKRRLDRGWEPDATKVTRLEAQQSAEIVVQSLVQSVQQHR